MSQVYTKQSFLRFSVFQRIEHWVLFLSFTTLALTGLPQKYPLSPISQGVVSLLGGIETIRIFHRVAATLFLLEAIYHVVVIGYKLWVRRERASMVPTLKDATDAAQSVQYNLGLRKDAPKMPRFTFAEKAEYWAMLWGLFVMAVTGFMLWNPIATTRLLPGEFIPAAKAAHGGEAVLAVLAIILWHFWHVHIRSFNKSIFTGRLSRHEMEDEHGHELELIERGAVRTVSAADAQAKRRMSIFTPIAAVVSLALLAGVYWFVTFEDSAITTIPPASGAGEAFVPQTPTPRPTEEPAQATPELPESAGGSGAAAAPAWSGDLETVFAEKCGACHGAVGGFSAESYVDVMEGVTPGEPDDSSVVQVQQAGGHPGMFSEAELQRVIDWIAAGAPEQAGEASSEGASAASTVSWDGGVGAAYAERCAACHGSTGGFSAESYEAVMEQVQPGEPEASPAFTVVSEGNHPGKFSEDELSLIREWIIAGAPQQ